MRPAETKIEAAMIKPHFSGQRTFSMCVHINGFPRRFNLDFWQTLLASGVLSMLALLPSEFLFRKTGFSDDAISMQPEVSMRTQANR